MTSMYVSDIILLISCSVRSDIWLTLLLVTSSDLLRFTLFRSGICLQSNNDIKITQK